MAASCSDAGCFIRGFGFRKVQLVTLPHFPQRELLMRTSRPGRAVGSPMSSVVRSEQTISLLTRSRPRCSLRQARRLPLVLGSSSICVSQSDRASQIEGIRPWYRRSIGLQPAACWWVKSARLRRVHGSYLADWLRLASALNAGRPQGSDMVGGGGGSRTFPLRAKRFGSSSMSVDGDVRTRIAVVVRFLITTPRWLRLMRAGRLDRRNSWAIWCVFRVMVGIDFAGSWAVISREAGH